MENKTFNYYLPQLGRLNVFLYSYTTKCYNLLDNYGHIERLKNIDQLGVIRNIYEGAHHPRWEYVILQLYLINRLKKLDLAKGLGLSSKTTNFLNYRPSGAEILQIWILLLNSGHLPGTFASERGLLRTFKESAKLRNVFKGGLRPEEKKFFNRILENEDIYSIHKILISFHLGRYHRFKDYDIEGSKFAEFLREIVNFYLFEPQDENLANRRFKLSQLLGE
jgi:HD superfamily phosphohydrolase